MKSKHRWIITLFREPGVWVSLPLAYALGILTMLPTGWELSPNAATVIAAGLTSMIAVGGAMAAWSYQQHRESQAIGKYVAHLLQVPMSDLRAVEDGCQHLATIESWSRFNKALENATGSMVRVEATYIRSNEVLLRLDTDAITLILGELLPVVKAVNNQLNQARQQSAQTATHMYGGPLANATELASACHGYRRLIDRMLPTLL